MSRRELMAALAAAGLGGIVASACAAEPPEWAPLDPGAHEVGPFPDGVMAGDPLDDGAVIWTRVLPPRGDPAATVPVIWSVAADASFSNILAGGAVVAGPGAGHCVSVRVSGLPSDGWYHYRFEAAGAASRVGRMRTAPSPGGSPDRLRFAFASCQQLSSQFVAHRAIAAEPDLDFLLHLGDYVYVNDELTLSLEDYRDCYRRWRRQPHLRDLHAAVPTVAMWDDGEFYNGIDRGGDPLRLEAAARAWFESFPVMDPGGRRAYRSLSWGGLVDLPVIDVRYFRDPASEETDYTTPGVPHDPARTTLGAEQFAWLTGVLGGSTAAWRVIGNPYNIAPWKLVNLEWLRPFRPGMPPDAGIYAPNEAWDDYLRERRDLLAYLADHDIADTVFASAHTHIYITSELRVDDRPGSAPVAVDFCTGSLTADPDPRIAYLPDLPLEVAEEVLEVAERWVIANNGPSMRHFNLVEQGYTVVEVTPEEMRVTHRVIDTHDPDALARDGARFRLRKGSSRLEVLACPDPVGVFA
jgi:alkaline phosphatase D